MSGEATHTETLRPQGGAVTATFVRKHFLDHSMESTAHNLDQFNPSPEVDSILEHLDELADQLPICPVKRRMKAFIRSAIQSNLCEGSECRQISGVADRLVADLHDIETNGVHRALGPKAIARVLRKPLQTLRTPDGRSARELADATAAVREVIRSVPRDQLLSDRVAHELAPRKAALLREMVR